MAERRRAGHASVKRTKRYAFVLLSVFILSTLAIAFHQHADGDDCHNCPVCAAAHYQAVVIGTFALDNPQPLAVLELPPGPLRFDFTAAATPPPRAPPA